MIFRAVFGNREIWYFFCTLILALLAALVWQFVLLPHDEFWMKAAREDDSSWLFSLSRLYWSPLGSGVLVGTVYAWLANKFLRVNAAGFFVLYLAFLLVMLSYFRGMDYVALLLGTAHPYLMVIGCWLGAAVGHLVEKEPAK